MKIKIITLALMTLLICSYINNSVLSQEITGVEIIPEYPTNTDEVYFAITTSFPFLDCRLDSLHPYFACGAFAYDAFYGSSFESGFCTRTDTISLGILSNGFYPLTFRMYYLGWAQVDQVDTVITVGTVGIAEGNGAGPGLDLWPNPSRGHINIVPEEGTDYLHLASSDGSLVKTIDVDNDLQKIKLTLSAGLYICTPFRKGRPLAAQKLIILEH